MKAKILGLLAAGLLTGPVAANATTWSFSFTVGADTISGELVGTLQADGNTIFASSVSNPTFNGAAAPALPVVRGFNEGTQAFVSINGLLMDFFALGPYALGDPVPATGFYIVGEGSPVYPAVGYASFSSVGGYGTANLAPFSASSWSIRSVPEPGTLALLGLGLAGLGLSRRARIVTLRSSCGESHGA